MYTKASYQVVFAFCNHVVPNFISCCSKLSHNLAQPILLHFPSLSLKVLLAINNFASSKLVHLCVYSYSSIYLKHPFLLFPLPYLPAHNLPIPQETSVCLSPHGVGYLLSTWCHTLTQPVLRRDTLSIYLSLLSRTTFPRSTPGDFPLHFFDQGCIPCLCPISREARNICGISGHHGGRFCQCIIHFATAT